MFDSIRSCLQPLRESFLALGVSVFGLERRQKNAVIFGMDLVLCLISIFIAFSLRVGALSFPIPVFLKFAAIAVPLFIPMFVFSGVYASIVRFTGARTIFQLAKACAFYAAPLIVIFAVWPVSGVPRTIAFLHPMIFFGLTGGLRILIRYLMMDIILPHKTGKRSSRVVIYGAGSAGQQLALALRHEPDKLLVGFVDDDVRLNGQRLDGLSIDHTSKLSEIIPARGVDSIILALPNATRRQKQEIVIGLAESEVRVLTLPRMSEIMGGEVSVNDLREVQVEDLLGRDAVPPNEILLSRTIVGKTVLVTGGGGSIGSELCRQILQIGPKALVVVEMTELALFQIDSELRAANALQGGAEIEILSVLLDVSDAASTARLFRSLRPDTVFHAAAYKHVPLVEANALAGMHNNIFGTLSAAQAAQMSGVTNFVLVSTDKAVRPTNIMGATKRVCELVLQGLNLEGADVKFGIVRFGNVLGSSGSVVPKFKDQIEQGGPVTITHREMTRYFMTIPEAAQLVIQASSLTKGGDLFLLDMGNPVKIHDLAVSLVHLSGLSVRDQGNSNGDIEILEIGLRPGEKLFEELLIDSESAPTTHPRIFTAAENCVGWEELRRELDVMRVAIDEGNLEVALSSLMRLVPEYCPDVTQVPKAISNA